MVGEEKTWRDDMGKYAKVSPVMADFEPDPKITALLLVDMQYYDAHPDYGSAKKYSQLYPELAKYYIPRITEVAIPNCAKLLKFFRERQLRVFYAAFGAAMPDASDALPLRKLRDAELQRQTGLKTLFTTDSLEYRILDELKPQPGEPVFNKKTRNSFCGTGLDHTLRMIGIECVVVVGAITNICVESTARGASDLGYKVILIDDATATCTQADQNTTMRTFALYFGKVMDTDELIQVLLKKL